MKPQLEETPDWYRGYIQKAPDAPLLESLISSDAAFMELISRLSDKQGSYRYAEGKWSIKDLILHIIDAERVFTYRALRFMRQDQTDLSGFDQDPYVENAKADHRTMQSLIVEYRSVRQATQTLFELNIDRLDHLGFVGGNRFSVNMLGYIIAGHQSHHTQIIKEKYLSGIDEQY